MKLHENKKNELLITEINNKIIVQTKEDLRLKDLRRVQKEFVLIVLVSITFGIALSFVIFNSLP